ncbi:MAG: hypothetical protein RL152_566, partial [Bacteroidota bacterium]
EIAAGIKGYINLIKETALQIEQLN